MDEGIAGRGMGGRRLIKNPENAEPPCCCFFSFFCFLLKNNN
jgi:hypothetical protein